MAAVVIGVALIVPVVLGNGSSGSCGASLTYLGNRYVARPTAGRAPVDAIAVGVGVIRGCGATSQNVNLRSIAGVPSSRAVAVAGASQIYVRPGICRAAEPGTLLTCLSR